MFTLKNREQMGRAIETARRNHPKVKVLTLGSYLVKGSAGNFYTVSMSREGAQKTVDCTCVAGQYGTPCYHSAAALGLHMGLVRVKRAAI
jgi:hypothetical protein